MAVHPNAAVIEQFYSAFRAKDYPGMAACYHPQIVFSDKVFPELRGWRANAMWHMFCATPGDRTITFDHVQADDSTGSAHWEANYDFSKTGRRVHNKIDARFRFQDGKIIDHRDSFDFWRWSTMALGTTGLLLGWTPIIRNKVQSEAAHSLEAFIAKNGLTA
ncbi:MAG: nuclear transport factor 2 family protein [Chloroflexota bacterium]